MGSRADGRLNQTQQSQARVGVDVGGTFTDLVVAHEGLLTIWKLPSTPQDQSEAFESGVREALARAGNPSPGVIAHGTTVATNAVLERRGARTALVTTEGFRDILLIGRQNRPSLYDMWTDRPSPLVPRELSDGIPERVGPDGEVILPLDETATAQSLRRLLEARPESVAVCLLFSFVNPDHEQRLRDLLARIAPTVRVSLSSEVLPEFREYERASTTALDAYVGPVIERYVGRISARVADLGAPVVVMRSGGGTMSAEQAAREAVHTLLSGPAAGVRGAAAVAEKAGFFDLVSFDMGGTSTDVCLVEKGEPAIAAESSVGGLPFRTPALAVHTVGAGGGSLLWIDQAGALRAGPRSAGALPGPACYGRGGTEPTVTDAHLMLGHLDPSSFLGGRVPLDEAAARRALQTIAAKLDAGVEELAVAGLAAVRAQMAKAIRIVTVERGRDPRDLALVGFGGAGPMHATALASQLEMGMVLVPPAPGVLSALGLLATPPTADASLTHPMVEPAPDQIEAIFAEISRRAEEALRRQGAVPVEVTRTIDCRYRGQAHEVPISADPLDAVSERFAAEHRGRFGWNAPGETVELITFRVRASGEVPELPLPPVPTGSGARPVARRQVWADGERVEAPVYDRAALGSGDEVSGPCVIRGEESTVVVEARWDLEVDRWGTLVARKQQWTR